MEYTQFKPIRTSASRPEPRPLDSSKSAVEEPGFFSRLFGLGRPEKTAAADAPPPAKAKVKRTARGPFCCFCFLFSFLEQQEEEEGPVARPWMPDNVVSRCHSCDLHFTAVRSLPDSTLFVCFLLIARSSLSGAPKTSLPRVRTDLLQCVRRQLLGPLVLWICGPRSDPRVQFLFSGPSPAVGAAENGRRKHGS